jgi:hypothetical protein
LRRNRVRIFSRPTITLSALGLAGLVAACGGGGGSGVAGPATSPTPQPTPVVPITPPGPSGSTAQIVLSDGDQIGDVPIANIEDASLGSGNAAAAVVTIANSGNRTAIVLRAADGTFTTAFDPRTADASIDSTSLTRLRMAPTGEMVFQTGRGLDTDRLFRIAGGTLTALAGAAPGPVFPDFRILGDVRIGPGGVVAFAAGGGSCQVTVSGDQQRVTCTNSLYVADQSGITALDDAKLDLSAQRPTAVRVEMDPAGAAWFSVPRRTDGPVLLRSAAGVTTTVLTGADTLNGVGQVNSAEADAINASGQALLLTSPQVFTGERRPSILGVLSGTSFAPIASEGTTLDGTNVATLRGLAIDNSGRALFEAELGEVDTPAAQANSLWFGDASDLVEIVREGAPFPGESTTVLSLLGSRLDAAGDVGFVTQLGSTDGGVTHIEETRASVRRTDGTLVTIASSRSTAQLGSLSGLQIVGFDDAGTMLLIGTRGRSSDRVLLMGRSDGATD